jgi:hypothetical protein
MKRIDEQEDELMSLDKEAWGTIESLFRKEVKND